MSSTTTIYKSRNGDEKIGFQTNKKINPERKITKKSRQVLEFDRPPHIIGKMSIVGAKEGKGPLGRFFARIEDDDKMGEKSFEKAEIHMLEDAIIGSISNAKLNVSDIDLLIAGDLLNQITSSSYVARDLKIPYLGTYSACSTMTECLAFASTLISSGYFDRIVCATASHFATAERQYRYPLEYGCQRPPYAQWTVTGSGSSVLSSEGDGPIISKAVIGKVIDFGTNDLNNMGAAMAPAALDSLLALFTETGTRPEDYDLIFTGDLGKLGSDILRDLAREQGYELGNRYTDCGAMIFGLDQNCYQGGSGSACSATVFNSFILSRMHEGRYNKVAYFATGALMSPTSCYQGETIPCISHGVVIENIGGKLC